jgi:hypothetical protein
MVSLSVFALVTSLWWRGGDEALVLLRSGSPVEGWFTARQEIPLERQLMAFALLLAGLVGVAVSIRIWKKGG